MRAPLDPEDRVVGWAVTVGITALALFLRLRDLATPNKFEFDETYYAKDAWSLAEFGYVRGYVEDADEQILAGTTSGLWTDDPSLIVHPEVGKWLIAAGEAAFGMDPFGWRISAVIAGSLMVLVMFRLALRLTGSILLGAVAGLLMTFDGLHFVLSRMALLDIFMALFMLMAVTCAVIDRDWFRARLDQRIAEPIADERSWGPVRAVLVRPWLLASGVCWGLAVGTKWTALFPLAAFGLMVWIWSAGARRSHGVRFPLARSALVDGVASSTRPPGPAGCSTPRSTSSPTPRRSTRGSADPGRARTASSSTTEAPTTGGRPHSRMMPEDWARSGSRCGRWPTITRTC
jgi:dolichyl-phosphate-mannose-protein mannosyltransferase